MYIFMNVLNIVHIYDQMKFLLMRGKVKVKSTLVQALRLCTGHTAHRGSRSIALLFLDYGTRKG